MAARNGSVVRRRMLGRQLRLLREEAGLTLDAAAPALDWSPSKLSRIEMGQQAVDVHGVRSMLDLYDVGGDRWTELVTLTRETRQKGWWQAYGVGDTSFVGFEAEASLVQEFTVDFVPGLLRPPTTAGPCSSPRRCGVPRAGWLTRWQCGRSASSA